MSNTTKRVEGGAEELGGKIKSTVGSALGNEQMEAEGEATAAKGEAKQAAAKAAERTKGKVEQLGGAVKDGVGKVLGNEQMEAEGTATKLKGEAREGANK